MLYRQVFIALIILSTGRVEAQPLTYQYCVEAYVREFQKAEIDAAKELLKVLGALQRFPEMQENVKISYRFGSKLREQHLDLTLQILKAICTE